VIKLKTVVLPAPFGPMSPANSRSSRRKSHLETVVQAIALGSGAFLHGFTYNAHPVCLAAGRAVLKFMKSHDLLKAADCDNKESIAGILKSQLESLNDLEVVGDVRGMGLLRAVEFVADKSTKRPFPPSQNFAAKVGHACSARGLLVYPMQGCVDGTSGDHLLLAPPAVITKEQVAWAVQNLREAILEAQ